MTTPIKLVSTPQYNFLTALKLITPLLLISILLLMYHTHSLKTTIANQNHQISLNSAEFNYQLKRYQVAQIILTDHNRSKTNSIHTKDTLLHLFSPEFELHLFFSTFYPALPSSTTTHYVHLLQQSGKQHNVDPLLLAALIRRESNWDPEAIGPIIRNQSKSKGYKAKGLSQILLVWHYDKLENLTNSKDKNLLFLPEVSIALGAETLREFLDRNNNQIDQALTGYVGGHHPHYNQSIFNTTQRIRHKAQRIRTEFLDYPPPPAPYVRQASNR